MNTLPDYLMFIFVVCVMPYVIYWLLKKLKLIAGLAVILCILAIPAFISGASEVAYHKSTLKKLQMERQKCIANIYRDMYNSCS